MRRSYLVGLALLLMLAISVFAVACGGGTTTTSAAATETTTADTAPATDTTAAPQTSETTAAISLDTKINVKPRTLGILNESGAASPTLMKGQTAVEMAAKALGWKTIIIDAQSDTQKTLAGFQSLVAQKVDAIITLTVEASWVRPGLAAAKDAGIPSVQATGGTEKSPLWTGQYEEDESEMGRVIGDYIARTYPNAKIAVMTASGGAAGRTRFESFKKALAGANTGATVVATAEQSMTDPVNTTIKGLGDILRANPDINIVYGIYDMSTPGSLAAIKNERSSAKFFSYYTSPYMVEQLMADTALEGVMDVELPKTAVIGVDQLLGLLEKNTPVDPDAIKNQGGLKYEVVARSEVAEKLPVPAEGLFPNSELVLKYITKWAQEYGTK